MNSNGSLNMPINVKPESIVCFDNQGLPSQDVCKLINKYAGFSRIKKLASFIQESETIDRLRDYAEKSLYAQLHYFAHLLYHIMELTGHWTDAGEHQVKVSFCRNLLNIDPEEQLNYLHSHEFLLKVSDNLKEHKIDTLSLEESKKVFDSFSFQLFTKSYSPYLIRDINKVLKVLDSKLFIQGGYYGNDQEYILGEGTIKKIGDYQTVRFENELIRTPNNIVAMAAVIGNNEIYLRMESIRTIFVQKWLPVLDLQFTSNQYPDFDVAISEAIKQQVMTLYKAKTLTQLKKVKKSFINDLAETVLYHEIGHGITQNNTLDKTISAIGEATRVFRENIFTTLHEILADFAMPKQKMSGSIFNMVTISKKNKTRAERMYYMYLSDTWFFDTQDKYMYLYSTIMSLIMLKFINKDKSIDFNQIEKLLLEKKGLIMQIINLFSLGVNEIKAVCKKATYILNQETVNFQKIDKEARAEVLQENKNVDETSYEFIVPYWNFILKQALNQPQLKLEIENILVEYEKQILNQVLQTLFPDYKQIDLAQVHLFIQEQFKIKSLFLS